MGTIETLKAACRETSEAARHLDAEVGRRLLKRARQYGMKTSDGEILVEAWRRAAEPTRRMTESKPKEPPN